MQVRIVVNYFGTPPAIFQLWLDSVGTNVKVQWLLFTDIDMSDYQVPSNVKVFRSDFGTMKRRIQAAIPFAVRYEKPYDFCALKPLIPIIFKEELKGADFWGWADLDVIFGDLTPVLDLAEQGYDKVMPNGHFSIVRNTPELSEFILKHRCTHAAVAIGEKGLPCYDERDFRFTVMHEYGARQASEIVPYIHLYPRWGHFSFNVSFAASRLLGLGNDGTCPVLFTWSEGRLLGHFVAHGGVKSLELAYVHFFKRNIRNRTGRLLDDGTKYLIEPTGVRRWDGGELTRMKILWINRPRMHWRYIYDRLNWKTVQRKLKVFYRMWLSRPRQNVEEIIYHSGC